MNFEDWAEAMMTRITTSADPHERARAAITLAAELDQLAERWVPGITEYSSPDIRQVNGEYYVHSEQG